MHKNNLTIFNKSELYVSLRSPFARRVRLAFLECEVQYVEKVIDVFKPPAVFLDKTILGRVPVLVFEDGKSIVDSNVILPFFHEMVGSKLLPSEMNERIIVSHWSGLAIGVCEKTVEYYLDSLRPDVERNKEISEELHEITSKFLLSLDKHLEPSPAFIISELSQADLDVGSAIDYLVLRYDQNILKNYPKISEYVECLRKRPSFKRTDPLSL